MSSDERVYWAHRLHATVLNAIGAAILQSQVCERALRSALPTSAEELTRLREMLVALEEQARSLASSATLPRSGSLASELAAKVRPVRRVGLPVRLRITGRTEEVPRRVVRGAGVVLTEALANAARHAHPSSVSVEVTVRDGALLLRVRDNGAGCDTARLEPAADRPCGIAIMRAQARTLRGRLELSSAPGRGTQVTLFVPLPTTARSRPAGIAADRPPGG